MSDNHTGTQRTNFFLGGDQRREELLAEPECTCGPCSCRDCTNCGQCQDPHCLGCEPQRGGTNNRVGVTQAGTTKYEASAAQYTLLSKTNITNQHVSGGWSSVKRVAASVGNVIRPWF